MVRVGLAIVAVVLAALWLASPAWDGDEPYRPFVWRDVAAVWLACAVPLALALTHLGQRWWRREPIRAGDVGWAGLAVVVLVVPPWVYAAARQRHVAAELGQLVDQERLGEARTLARHLAAFDPLAEVRETRIDRVVGELDRRVRALEAEAANPATAPLDRARALAMLGRSGPALDALEPLTGPEADSLRGLIHETRGDWPAGVAAYRAARAALPTSGQAVRGEAYCLRKAGDYGAAEAAYRDLLALAPTAETHFLLAQFYEDAQQAEKSHHHARQAMALDPRRFRRPGEAMLDKLQTSHFGCLRVFAAEASRPRGSLLSR